MKFDNLIECTRCGSDACYTQEVTKDITIEMCYGCGFQSNSLMKRDTDFFINQMELLPDLYKVLLDEEEDGKIWMPSTVNIPDKGMIFANGKGRDNWKWGAVKAIPVSEEEKEKFKGVDFRTDITTAEYFEERDYMEALSYIDILP